MIEGYPDLWTDEFLTARRQDGDPEADQLAEKLFKPGQTKNPFGGRLGYNPILDLADTLTRNAELGFSGRFGNERAPEAIRSGVAEILSPHARARLG